MDAQKDFPLVFSIHLTAAFGNTSTALISGIHTQCVMGAGFVGESGTQVKICQS